MTAEPSLEETSIAPGGPAGPPEPSAGVLLDRPQDLLGHALEVADIGPYFIDLDRGVIHLSSQLARMMRVGDAELEVPLDEWRSRFYHPDDAAKIRDQAAAAFADGQIAWIEGRLVRADGEVIFVRGRLGPVPGPGRVFVGAAQDVTRQVRAHEAEILLNRALEVADIGTYFIDVDRDVIHLSSHMAHLLRAGDAAMEMPVPEFRTRFYHPDDAEKIRTTIRSAFSQGEGAEATADGRLIRADGEVIFVRSRLSVERGPSGEALAVGVTQDVTPQVRAEQGLRDSEARFRSMIEGAEIAIGLARDGTTIWANAPYCRMFGFDSHDGLIGHPLAEQIAPDDRTLVRERSIRRLRGEKVPPLYETHGLRRDGSTFPLLIAASTVDLPDGTANLVFMSDLTPLKEAEADLAFEAEIRASLLDALRQLPEGASVQDTAGVVCRSLAEVQGVDVVAVVAHADGLVWTLAAAGRADLLPPSSWSEVSRTRHVLEMAAQGPFAERWVPRDDDAEWSRTLSGAGTRALGCAPIVHAGHLDGVVVIGTCDAAFGESMVERFVRVADLSGPASALLAERVHDWRRSKQVRANLERVIAERAFRPVFQPIADLETGEAVAYEALTRFDSGQRPDHCFADAWSAGIGAELELATLEVSIAAAKGLPAGRCLNINASPRLLGERAALARILGSADRPVALEITEHETISDYEAIRNAVAALGPDVRLAVDDAGVGIANFSHIVELRPDFVKIDVSLVRGVNSSLGRQALVVAMQHFARTAGCRLIAEGIETEAEMGSLAELGVEFGQGYLLGRPEAAEYWASRETSEARS